MVLLQFGTAQDGVIFIEVPVTATSPRKPQRRLIAVKGWQLAVGL